MRVWLSTVMLAAALAQVNAAGAAPLSWAELDGRPPGIEHRSVSGVYVWREGERVYLLGIGDPAKARLYDGRIIAHGATLSDGRRFIGGHDRTREGVREVSSTELTYALHSEGGYGGVSFVVSRLGRGWHGWDWGALDFALRSDKHPSPRIFFGPRALEAQQDPVVVTFGDNQPVSWESFEGKPDFADLRSSGVYAWRQGDRIRLASVEREGRTRHVRGRIVVCGGTISDVRGDNREWGDWVHQANPTELDYAFETSHETDEVSFTLRPHAALPPDESGYHRYHAMSQGYLYILPSTEARWAGRLRYGAAARDSVHDPLIVAFPPAQPLSWAEAEGRPSMFATQSGYQVWHEGDRVFVISSNPDRRKRRLAGQILFSGGTLADPRGFNLGTPGDKLTQPNPVQLDFGFTGDDERDGISFTIVRKTKDRSILDWLLQNKRKPAGPGFLTLDLHIDNRITDHIFFGPRGVEARQDPLTFYLP